MLILSEDALLDCAGIKIPGEIADFDAFFYQHIPRHEMAHGQCLVSTGEFFPFNWESEVMWLPLFVIIASRKVFVPFDSKTASNGLRPYSRVMRTEETGPNRATSTLSVPRLRICSA
jgi:hypothetical protein